MNFLFVVAVFMENDHKEKSLINILLLWDKFCDVVTEYWTATVTNSNSGLLSVTGNYFQLLSYLFNIEWSI